MKNKIKIVCFLFLVLSIFSFKKYTIPLKEYNYDVTIYRDIWGVPHIYGNTDEDVAFGLAYAHSEDDFKSIQTVLIATRGSLGLTCSNLIDRPGYRFNCGCAHNWSIFLLSRRQRVKNHGILCQYDSSTCCCHP